MSGGIHGDSAVLDRIKRGRALFALVVSYTRTAEIPGITAAGADADSIKCTPPADAELIQHGLCRSIRGIPATPDGKPTPALITRAALQAASIPRVTVDAGSMIRPRLPHVYTGMVPGEDISRYPAMTKNRTRQAISYGKQTAGMLSGMCDCLIVGESIPGGTTTALALMRGLNLQAKVSSSMPQNPHTIKQEAVESALGRLHTDDPLDVAAQTADPMIPFVAGMLGGASVPVLLAGGTQMLAVLALADRLGPIPNNVAICTTSYVAEDDTIRFRDQADIISPDTQVVSTDLLLQESRHDGLRAYARGFAKEGAGAGGAVIASRTRAGLDQNQMLELVDKEYDRIITLR